MLSKEEIGKILKKEDIRALKSLGQNFLIDEKVLEKIVGSAQLSENDVVIEIGPGLGTLTKELSKKCRVVFAIEKDRKLARMLKGKFTNVEAIEGDVLKLNINDLVGKYSKDVKYKLVANIPYYITSKIIKLFLETSAYPESIVILAQKEVAQRICAKAGKLSILALSVQIFGEPEIVSFVGKNSFFPVPEVDSAILRITNIKKSETDEFYGKFFRIIKIGFSAKRKKLSRNLSAGFQLNMDEVGKKLEKIGIGPNARAQELSLEQWKKLMEVF